MVEGALIEDGRQPRNVRVQLLETSEGVAIRLEDGDGVFMELPPVEEEPLGEEGATHGGGGDGESNDGGEHENEEEGDSGERELDPVARLRAAEDKIVELQGEVSALREELDEERAQLES